MCSSVAKTLLMIAIYSLQLTTVLLKTASARHVAQLSERYSRGLDSELVRVDSVEEFASDDLKPEYSMRTIVKQALHATVDCWTYHRGPQLQRRASQRMTFAQPLQFPPKPLPPLLSSRAIVRMVAERALLCAAAMLLPTERISALVAFRFRLLSSLQLPPIDVACSSPDAGR